MKAAIGRYKHTEALFNAPNLECESFPVISRAFKPMVRSEAFDVSEMAIATFLQARAHGSDLVLLPVILSARFQNAAMLRLASNPFGPADLRGKRIGVRAYSQTTGLWLRGILQEEYGISPPDIAWTTFEDAHVAASVDPPWATRAPPGADILAMLRNGDLDAAVFGAETPGDPDLATVFPDPDAAAAVFRARHNLVPINHMVCVRAAIAAQPGVVRGLIDQFRAAGNPHPMGRAAIDPAVALAIRYAAEQGMLPRPLTLEDVWAGLPPGCAD